jgi:hypothetical protein
LLHSDGTLFSSTFSWGSLCHWSHSTLYFSFYFRCRRSCAFCKTGGFPLISVGIGKFSRTVFHHRLYLFPKED